MNTDHIVAVNKFHVTMPKLLRINDLRYLYLLNTDMKTCK
jgi:hypothetical protein